MNEYSNIYNQIERLSKTRKTIDILFTCLAFTSLVLGGLIGFDIGYHFPSQQHRTVVTHQIVLDHKTVTDYRVVTVPNKQPVTCKVIDYRAGDLKPYTMLQCSDGSIKVIYT